MTQTGTNGSTATYSTGELARWMRDERGFSVIPLDHPDAPFADDPKQVGKIPVIPWAGFQHDYPTDAQLAAWFTPGRPRNLAIVTGEKSGIVVVDCDSPEAEAYAAANLPATEMATRTGSGGLHLFFRHPGGSVRNRARMRTLTGEIKIDVRGDGGYVVAPLSKHASGRLYERVGTWPKVDSLPVFNPEWLQPELPSVNTRPPVVPLSPTSDVVSRLTRGRAYLERMGGAIEGSGGDQHTFRACAWLVNDLGLSDSDALALLESWNATMCVPPWTQRELQSKIESARKYGRHPIGSAGDRPAPSSQVGGTARIGNADVGELVDSDNLPPTDEENEPDTVGKGKGGGRDSASTMLVRYVEDSGAELFHTPANEPYISIAREGHRETYPLKSKSVKDWLCRAHYDATGKTPNAAAVMDALQTLAGRAWFDGLEHDVFLRIAHTDVAIYVDLGDASWSAIEITAAGWSIVTVPPVRFRRPKGYGALPSPVRGGSLALLRELINFASDESFVLTAGWLVGAMRPPAKKGAYAVLTISGEMGSAKSGATEILHQTIDPCDSPLRASPRDERDLMVAAANTHIVAFDNVSKLPDSMSDVLCRLASGTAYSTRQLYSDDEETVLKAHRPVVINGIANVVTRGDLLDRAIAIVLPVIPEHKRKREDDVWATFHKHHPALLGALLDAVAAALARQDTIEIANLPRLADFVTFVVAAEPACPWTDGAFLTAFRGSQDVAMEFSLDGDPVADAVRALPNDWRGTMKDLKAKVTEGMTESASRQFTPRGLSAELIRLQPLLRRTGIAIYPPQGKGGGGAKGRQYRILRTDLSGTSVDDRDGSLSPNLSTVPPETVENRPVLASRGGRGGRDGVSGGLFAGKPDGAEEAVDVAEF